MKIIAILDTSISSGGGFNQALNAIIQMKRICQNRFEFVVVTTIKENLQSLGSNNINASYIKETLWDKLISKFTEYTLIKHFKNWSNPHWLYPFERKLIALNADLVYFVTPNNTPKLRLLNYIYTVWDHSHRDTPEFPEVRQYGTFQHREYLFHSALPSAFLIITDSQLLVDNIARIYAIDKDRLISMPFFPSPSLIVNSYSSSMTILEKYKLKKGYYFYPAQLWPHKNHIRLLEALAILHNEEFYPNVVFVGGDKGNFPIIQSFIQKHELQKQVKMLGFVPSDELFSLYDGCRAVIMPTYFGPTNIPPLEAWLVGKPLIYSAHLKEQASGAALLIDPDNAEDIANAMRLCLDESICEELVKRGHERLHEIEKDREQAEIYLLTKLFQFEKRLRCWKV